MEKTGTWWDMERDMVEAHWKTDLEFKKNPLVIWLNELK